MYVDESSFINRTNFHDLLGPDHSAIKPILGTYHLVMMIVGIMGNFVVLLGSFKYNALQMDSHSVVMLRHIALADLITMFVFYIPRFISLVAGGWILGSVVCYSFMLRWVPITSEQMFIALLSCHRAYLLYRPLHGALVGHIIIKWVFIGVWVWFVLLYCGFTAINDGPIVYYHPDKDCSFDPLGISEPERVFILVGCVQAAMLISVSVIANITLFFFISKPGLKAVKTISIICGIYVVSFVPSFVGYMMLGAGYFKYLDHVSLVSTYSMSVNMIANPFVYSFTNKKFAFFLKSLVKCNLLSFIQQWNRKQNPVVTSSRTKETTT